MTRPHRRPAVIRGSQVVSADDEGSLVAERNGRRGACGARVNTAANGDTIARYQLGETSANSHVTAAGANRQPYTSQIE